MDQVTQQNAALVEEMAAAASSLQSQATDLVQVVAVFKLGAADHAGPGASQRMRPAPKKSPPKAIAQSAAPRLAPRKITQFKTDNTKALGNAQRKSTDKGNDDWESF